jgi:hypothetical protein
VGSIPTGCIFFFFYFFETENAGMGSVEKATDCAIQEGTSGQEKKKNNSKTQKFLLFYFIEQN